MHIQELITQLKQFTEQDWNQLLEGAQLVMHEDELLQIKTDAAENIFLTAESVQAESADELQERAINQAETCLTEYYQQHPLTQQGFYRKALPLVKDREQDFAAEGMQEPNCTLFVEGGEIIAEDKSSPKHRYGVHCELPDDFEQDAIPTIVLQWLESGEAHDSYMGMNVCRYGC